MKSAAGTGGKNNKDKEKDSEKDSDKNPGTDVEARINKAVLHVPECGVCAACTEKTTRRKLCKDRLAVRQKLIASSFKDVQLPEQLEKAKKNNSKKRKAENPTPNTKKTKAYNSTGSKKTLSPKPATKSPNGQLKTRVTSNGNKRMSIPDDLLPEFCRRIGAHGTGERVNVINKFVEDNPAISIRQVTLKLSEITTRERPPWVPEPDKKQGRAFMFYLRPRFYPLLPENERPEGWQDAAEEDERKWEEEKKASRDKENIKGSEGENKRDSMDSIGDDGVSEDDTEDDLNDEPPPKKKTKIEA